tara:strand:+ start:142 stop:378 length:237 start_codon:yes stop_codon:yes gene_type:complete
MQIKYIIDYKGYGDIYQLTNTRNGECLDITKEEAKDFDESTTFFSVRADVSLNSVEQFEVPIHRRARLLGMPSQRHDW